MSQNNSFSVRTSRATSCPLWTALITPFSLDGDIDFISLKAIATTQAQAGNGLLLLGSTGEGLSLTSEEQFSLVEFVCQLALDIPLMVAVGGYNLTEQVAWVNRCNDLPIDAFLLGSPLYAKPGPVGQTQWFSRLLDEAKFPCMLYNVPSRSGVEIPLKTVQSVQTHPNCWAIKEASGDINKFLSYRQHCPDVDLYSGEDAMLPYLAPAGAKGLVSVCANTWPQATNRYVDLCLNGTQQQVHNLFPLWQNAVDSLFSVANPIPAKVLMHQQKVISTPILRAPLTHLELVDDSDILSFDQQIKHWMAEHCQLEPSVVNQ